MVGETSNYPPFQDTKCMGRPKFFELLQTESSVCNQKEFDNIFTEGKTKEYKVGRKLIDNKRTRNCIQTPKK